MGDIIAFGNKANLPTNPSDLQNLGLAASSIGPSSGDGDLLRLLRDGAWAFGAENIEPEEDSLWAVNPYSFKHGFIAWHDSKVQGEVMVPIMQPMPPRSELAEVPDGWADQISFQLQCVSGEDKGQVCEFKTTSVGGKREASNMATTIASQAASDPDHVVPVVTLGVDHYTHKKYGKIYTPSLVVTKWAAMGDVGESVEAEPTKGRRRSK